MRGSEKILEALKSIRAEQGLNRVFRVTQSGCLGGCASGPSVLVARTGSDGQPTDVVMYSGFRADDAKELVESHFIAGEPIERLRSKPEWLD